MNGRSISIGRPRRLPIQVPLRAGENPDTFVRRLAVANHLRPSYLRTYLADPPGRIGAIQIWRLAAVTARTEEELVRVMPALQVAHRKPPRPRRSRPQLDLYTAIRRAAERDEDVKRLTEHFGLRRPTTIKALTGQDLPTTWFGKLRSQRNPILEPVAEHLDRLIADNPNATITWIYKTLSQDQPHGASYGTVRNYINRVRAQPADVKSLQHLVSRAELFTRIRDEAHNDDLTHRLATQFATDHATVIRALTGEDAIREPKRTKGNPILEDHRHHIAEMITANPDVTVSAIWEQLVNEHNAEVSYATVRNYVARECRPPRPRSNTNTTQAPKQREPQSGAP